MGMSVTRPFNPLTGGPLTGGVGYLRSRRILMIAPTKPARSRAINGKGLQLWL